MSSVTLAVCHEITEHVDIITTANTSLFTQHCAALIRSDSQCKHCCLITQSMNWNVERQHQWSVSAQVWTDRVLYFVFTFVFSHSSFNRRQMSSVTCSRLHFLFARVKTGSCSFRTLVKVDVGMLSFTHPLVTQRRQDHSEEIGRLD